MTRIRQHTNSESASNTLIQPQLEVGATGDIYEKEADSVADEVMKMSEEKPQEKMHVGDEGV